VDRQTDQKAVRRLGTRAANTYVTDGSMLRSGRPGPGPGPAVMLRQRVRGRRNGPELRLGSFVLPRTPRGRRSGRNSGTWMARAEFPCGCCCSHAVVIDSSLSTVVGVSCNTTHVQWDETEKVCAQRSAQVQNSALDARVREIRDALSVDDSVSVLSTQVIRAWEYSVVCLLARRHPPTHRRTRRLAPPPCSCWLG
jgi:hypothetical protein